MYTWKWNWCLLNWIISGHIRPWSLKYTVPLLIQDVPHPRGKIYHPKNDSCEILPTHIWSQQNMINFFQTVDELYSTCNSIISIIIVKSNRLRLIKFSCLRTNFLFLFYKQFFDGLDSITLFLICCYLKQWKDYIYLYKIISKLL